MAIYEPPDYRKLYEEERKLIDKLHDEKKVLCESLRDSFAMAALRAVITESTWEPIGETKQYEPRYILVAEMSYMMADAMIKARKEK